MLITTHLKPPSFFSYQAVENAPDKGSESWTARVILSCAKQRGASFPSVNRQELKVTGELERESLIKSMVEGVKKAAVPTQDKRKLWVDQLAHFLLELQNSKVSFKKLFDLFKKLDQDCVQKTLSKSVESTLGGSFGEDQIQKDPQILLRLLDSSGNNCVEALIEMLHSSSDALADSLDLSEEDLSSLEKMPRTFVLYEEEGFIGRVSRNQDDFYETIARRYCSEAISQGIFSLDLLEQLSITPPQIRARVAKFCVEKVCGRHFPMQELNIVEEEDRLEIAKILVQKEPFLMIYGDGTTQEWLKSFNLSDQNLVEVLKISVEKQPRFIEKMAEFFGVHMTEEKAKTALASFCARIDGCMTAKTFQKFQIEEEKNRVAVARICFSSQKSGMVPEYIENFEIADESIRFELAKASASQSNQSYSLIECIEKFNLTKEGDRVEIAEMIAKKDSRIAEHIQNFQLANEANRIKIAQLLALQPQSLIVSHMGNFYISKEEDRVEIARAMLSKDSLIYNIQALNLTEESNKVSLAKHCAAANPDLTIRYFQNFQIEQEANRAEIVRACIQSGAQSILVNQSEFHLSLKAAFELHVIGILMEIPRLKSDDSLMEYSCFLDALFGSCFTHTEKENVLNALLGADKERFFTSIGNLHFIAENMSELEKAFKVDSKVNELLIDPSVDTRAWRKMGVCLSALASSPERALTQEMKRTLVAILKYRNRPLSESLSHVFNSSIISRMDAYLSLIRNGKGQLLEYLRLPMIYIAKWTSSLESSSTEVSCIIESIRELRSSFKDKESNVLQNWLLAAQALDERKDLLPNEKIDLLSQMFEQGLNLKGIEKESTLTRSEYTKNYLARLKENLSFLTILTSHCEVKTLRQNFSVNTAEKLSAALTATFEKDTYLNLRGIVNFPEKLSKTLGSMRVPQAWKTYQLRIQQIQDPFLQQTFQNLILSVLEGTYKEYRYNPTGSPHIQRIGEKHAEIWERWKSPVQAEEIFLDKSNQKIEPVNFTKFVKQKVEDGHLSFEEEIFPHIRAFLNSARELKDLAAPQSSEALLMELCSLSTDELTDSRLGELEENLSKTYGNRPCEFIHDVRALRKELKNDNPSERFHLVDTDDWQDLFLCGTEVSSCQRVDGDPEYNKCLLAYLVDGKNRMLAIKDVDNGKIIGRCIFRLLWDPDAEKPVLFRDRIYPNYSNRFESVLDNYAKKRAEQIGCSLYKKEGELRSEQFSRHRIASLGSSAPFEYEDALAYGWGESVMPRGVFYIQNPTLVFSSTSKLLI